MRAANDINLKPFFQTTVDLQLILACASHRGYSILFHGAKIERLLMSPCCCANKYQKSQIDVTWQKH